MRACPDPFDTVRRRVARRARAALTPLLAASLADAAPLAPVTPLTPPARPAAAELHARRATITSERAAREEATQALAQRLEHYSAGGLDVEIVGAAWIVIGRAFGSFPVEIRRLLT